MMMMMMMIYGEMVNFGKSNKMRKIRGKVDKPSTENGISNDIHLFISNIRFKFNMYSHLMS